MAFPLPVPDRRWVYGRAGAWTKTLQEELLDQTGLSGQNCEKSYLSTIILQYHLSSKLNKATFLKLSFASLPILKTETLSSYTGTQTNRSKVTQIEVNCPIHPSWLVAIPGLQLSILGSHLLFFFSKIFYSFSDRGEGKEKERENHQYVVPSHVLPTGDLACNSGMCPDWESNPWSSASQSTLSSLSHTSQGPFSVLHTTIYCFIAMHFWGVKFLSKFTFLYFFSILSKAIFVDAAQLFDP